MIVLLGDQPKIAGPYSSAFTLECLAGQMNIVYWYVWNIDHVLCIRYES